MEILANILLFGMPGGPEWLIIILFVIIFFGAKKIPELARGLGKGIREFKDATKGVKDEIEEGIKSVDDEVKKAAKD
jgi:sec-independent protein translocase protein TatA